MRYIPRYCLTENSVLAKSILGARGEVLLEAGIKMTPRYIRRLEQLGIRGAFVDDPISEGIEIADAISDELRSETIRLVSSIYTAPVRSHRSARSNALHMMRTAEQIVDDIIAHESTIVNLIDIKNYDAYTFFHCVNTTVLCVVIGLGMDLPRYELVDLAYASLMHDVGKLFIDSAIINKPGKLTADEYDLVKTHAEEGYSYLKDKYLSSEMIARGALDHHERISGNGYPDGKRGTEISLFGRIIGVADVYDALISDRPYREGLFPVDAVAYIQGGADKDFDFDVVSVFSHKIAPFPVGTCVKLSDGNTGIVMENIEGFLTRPLLRVFKSCENGIMPFELNLSEGSFDITIVEMLKI